MASFSILTKILADFLLGFYLLTLALKYATNHTHQRWHTLKNDYGNTSKTWIEKQKVDRKLFG